jgi:pyruvate carboxylase
VTEEVTGIDIVKAQIHIAEGLAIGDAASGIPTQDEIKLHGHAMQCRITTEDPDQNFIPDYGRITAYRGATGFGIRLDGGTAYSGAVITRFYDPLLEKVTAWAPTPEETRKRMDRALREFRIRGVATNLTFLENVIGHPSFIDGSYTTRFVDETPGTVRGRQAPGPRHQASHLHCRCHRQRPSGNQGPAPAARRCRSAALPPFSGDPKPGTKQKLDELGPEGFARWMKEQKRVLVTDTTMRDGHQSLLATRMRSFDIVSLAPIYARGLPELLSLECWGGATFDVAMRFLTEDPWERLANIREGAPNILTQMLLRGSNGVGYTNYPDNVVRQFVDQAARGGMDLFRVFDCLNWVENMRVSMQAVREAGKLCEGVLVLHRRHRRSGSREIFAAYYVDLAKQLEDAGAHIIGIKDMAGLLKPAAATALIKALKDATDLPLHLHTHDTSGISGASVLAAVEAGVDAVDAAMDAMSGMTSQPALGSIVAALESTDRATGLDMDAIRKISFAWEDIRRQYSAFESDLKAPASEVYLHEMPGGQFTNLKEQARVARPCQSLARGRQDLCRGQPDVRRYREGDAVLQGGR